eukprot:CAMPEP_0119270612 /NCGR_PEP_ID=MMETSP1329-20130426/7545_1 /TAXON_ID=114041 /ORGANISM="Genus nov. species nov., Strain RCC1024" /LENGTH=135 /DNA_ID=CAMNT_0007270637 /DNA_START=155 /DNA_END=558 /DNA_ORIENTATION=-
MSESDSATGAADDPGLDAAADVATTASWFLRRWRDGENSSETPAPAAPVRAQAAPVTRTPPPPPDDDWVDVAASEPLRLLESKVRQVETASKAAADKLRRQILKRPENADALADEAMRRAARGAAAEEPVVLGTA